MSKNLNSSVLRASAPRASALRAIAIAVVAIGSIGAAGIAMGDDPPPADNPQGHDHHHDPAWAACKKQADDQKLQPGDARHEFMKSCLKSAKSAPPPAAP
jgi:psiF repeat